MANRQLEKQLQDLASQVVSGLGRAAVRAGTQALDSLLSDAQDIIGGVLGEADSRVKKARARTKRIQDRARTPKGR